MIKRRRVATEYIYTMNFRGNMVLELLEIKDVENYIQDQKNKINKFQMS